MGLRWFLSSTVRQTTDLLHRVEKVLHAQRDILTPGAIGNVEAVCEDMRDALKVGGSDQMLVEKANRLEEQAKRFLRPYPFANVRENVDVILVAMVLALAIRTFFFQPMAIPTGSMQPTLYGIMPSRPTYEKDLQIPSLPRRIYESLFLGTSYYHVVAKEDGEFKGLEAPKTFFPLVSRQRFLVGNQVYTIWFPPEKFEDRAKLEIGQKFKKGEDIVKVKVTSGDRLFVDRVSYNFIRPQRGDIVIFASSGIPQLTQDTHYIKRLVGLPGEVLQVGNDRHLIVDGKRLDASTPKFENLYSFTGPPKENLYSGHVNDVVGTQAGRQGMAPLFPDEQKKFQVSPGRFVVMGDNTMNSYDSRYWGDFPREKVVGRHFFVFWPISSRFGWAAH